MIKDSIKRQSIMPRIDGIHRDIEKLAVLSKLPLEEFSQEDNFIKSQFYLRRALEGVFHIGSHILSRVPGARSTEYKEIALNLGKYEIVGKAFSENNLKAMAGYRNRLTHFYADITPEEILNILKNHLSDFDTFLNSIKVLLTNPEKFNLKLD